ncbi:protein kinase [Trypanosoma cruzi]|nr:protein kinase [Trypanosoma cruzi]
MEEEGFSYHAGLGARGTLSLIGLSRRLATHHGHWVDNTSLQGAANKGGSQSHAMTWEPQRIYEFLDSRGVQASVAYVRSAEGQPPQTAYHTVVFLHFRTWRRVELAKGSGGVLWLEDPKVCHFVSNKYIYIQSE